MIFNMTGGGGNSDCKSSIIVTAPTGSTVTATLDDVTKHANEDNGTWTFTGCDIGTWIIHAISGDQLQETEYSVIIQTENQLVKYYITLAYFAATIITTWPAGSTCICFKGDIVFEASDTSGSYIFAVPEAGDWTVSCNNGLSGDEYEETSKTVTITEDGQSESVELSYRDYVAELYASGFGYYSEGYAGTYVRSGGRGFTRASILPVIFTWQYIGPANSGYCMIAASEEALAAESVTTYGDMTKTTIETEYGILYIGYQKYNMRNGTPYEINENGYSITLSTSKISNCYNQLSNSISSDLMLYVEQLLFG